MANRYKPSRQTPAFEALELNGPQTSYEVAAFYGSLADEQRWFMALYKLNMKRPKVIYVLKYVRNHDANKRVNWIPVWAVGDKKDAVRPPKQTKSEGHKQYYEKHKVVIRLRAKSKRRKTLPKPGIIDHWKLLLGGM